MFSGTISVYADDSKPKVMIYKDGKFIWVDSDSEEEKKDFVMVY